MNSNFNNEKDYKNKNISHKNGKALNLKGIVTANKGIISVLCCACLITGGAVKTMSYDQDHHLKKDKDKTEEQLSRPVINSGSAIPLEDLIGELSSSSINLSSSSSNFDGLLNIQSSSSQDKTNEQNPDTGVSDRYATITGRNIISIIGSDINPILDMNISSFDSIDGDITSKVKVISTNYDGSRPGEYYFTFRVVNSRGYTTDITYNILLTTGDNPIIKQDKDIYINQRENFDITDYLSAFDKEDGDISDKIFISSDGGLNLDKPGKYKVVLSVIDSHGNKTSLTVDIYIVAVDEVFDISDILIQKDGEIVYYLEKSSSFEIEFTVESTVDSLAEAVVINGVEKQIFSRTKVESSNDYYINKYKILLDSSSFSKLQEYHITQLVLQDKQRISVNSSVSLETLKDDISIKDFSYIDNGEEGRLDISLGIDDVDKAFIGGSISITDIDGNQLDKIYINNFSEDGIFTHSFELDVNREYYISGYIEQDRDFNNFNDITGDQNKSIKEAIPLTKVVVSKRVFEARDIYSVEIFKEGLDGIWNLIDKSYFNQDEKDIDLSSLVAQIKSQTTPTLNMGIKSYKWNGDDLSILFDMEDIVYYDDNIVRHEKLELAFPLSEEKYSYIEYIPSMNRLEGIDIFKGEYLTAYANIAKLMPFYESEYIIKYANTLPNDDILLQKYITEIIPLKDGKIVTSLSKEDYDSLDSINVIFQDGEIKTYTIISPSLKEHGIIEYKIQGTELVYNYKNFALEANSDLINQISNDINNLEYKDILAFVGEEYDDSHDIDGNIVEKNIDNYLMKESFNNLKLDSLSTISNIISNNSKFNIEHINEKNKDFIFYQIKQELIQIIFSQSYISRWYDIDLNGVLLSDIIMYYPSAFLYGNNFSDIVGAFDDIDFPDRDIVMATNTANMFKSKLSLITASPDISSFIERSISMIAGVKNYDSWFFDNFDGLIKEVSLNNHPDIPYTAWSLIKSNQSSPNGDWVLPALSYKGGDMYIVSSAGSIIIGDLSIYTDLSIENKKDKVAFIGNSIKYYYDTLTRIDPTIVDNFSKTRNVIFDTLKNPDGEWTDFTDKENTFTNQFLLATGNILSNKNNISSFVDNDKGYLVDQRLLDGINGYTEFTSIVGKLQSDKLFFGLESFRGDISTDILTDGFLKHVGIDPMLGFNFGVGYKNISDTYTNSTYNIFNSKKDIENFYKKAITSLYISDIIEADVVLSLTEEQQSSIMVKYNETTNMFDILTTEEILKMNISNIDDLIDNKIGFRKNTNEIFKGDGISLEEVSFFQTFDRSGNSNISDIQRMSFEILGFKGFEGMKSYLDGSKGYKNDLEAIRGVFGDESLTFDSYKKDIFKYIKSKMSSEELAGINLIELKSNFKDLYNRAIISSDFTNLKTLKAGIFKDIKSYTGDFASNIFSEDEKPEVSYEISTAEEFIEYLTADPFGDFKIIADIDFVGINVENDYYVENFNGSIDGNNHTIKGISKPLIKNIDGAIVANIKITASQISSAKDINIGFIGMNGRNSNFSNIYILRSNISSTSFNSYVGSILGSDRNSVISNSSVKSGNVFGNGNSAGGLVGTKIGGTISNSYSSGTSIVGGFTNTFAGGLIGINSGSIINSYSSSNITSVFIAGGLVGNGNFEDMSLIENNFFSGRSSGGKIYGIANIDKFKNNYELEKSEGDSNIADDKIKQVDFSISSTSDFYSNLLGWDTVNIWDISDLERGILPKLNNINDDQDSELIPK
ncbi:MAG: hypothetical protein KFW09_06245 [Oscillospiraceae bacterium]|nr:hypothetical protein [Oscillospiraceae bacterium]